MTQSVPCQRCGGDTDEHTQPCATCWPSVDPCEALRAENEELRAKLDAAQLRSIEARNPGIDMDEVRRLRAEQG